jgi:hypothetical protein
MGGGLSVIDLLIPSLITWIEVSGQPHASTPLPSVPMQGEAGWVPEPVWMFWRTDKYLTLATIRTPDRPAIA